MNRRKSISAGIASLGLMLLPASSGAQQATTKDQLVGSWKVLNLKATVGDKVTYPLSASRWQAT